MPPSRDDLLLHELAKNLRTGSRLPTLQAQLLLILARHCRGGEADFPRVSDLARTIGCERHAIREALAGLVRKGLVDDWTETRVTEEVVTHEARIRRVRVAPHALLEGEQVA